MAKQFKKGQVSATRAYQIADSLTKKAQLQAGATDYKGAKFPKQLLSSSEANYQKAERIRSAADKAMKKATAGRDTPLPSSDGIISKIKNWFD